MMSMTLSMGMDILDILHAWNEARVGEVHRPGIVIFAMIYIVHHRFWSNGSRS
jgi:hypothetical protein